MKKEITFRDADMTRFTVGIEVKECDKKLRNRETLAYFHESKEISVVGEYGAGCGQCYDSINPRTEGQKLIKEFWGKYHLNNMCGGTVDQEDYLYSGAYQTDVKAAETAAKLFYSQPHTHDFMLNDLAKVFGEDTYKSVVLLQFEDMEVKKIKTLLEDWMRQFRPNYDGKIHIDPKDHYVRCAMLTVKGLWNDRGYTYGSGWLFDPIPEDIEDQIDSLAEMIEEEEDELTEQLEAVFDMGADGFDAAPERVEQVMELRECDEDEAIKFLVVGQHLGVTFGDLNASFELNGEHGVTAMGCDFYVGTDNELTEYVKELVHEDDEYTYLWKEAVADGKTEKGLDEWLDYIVDEDGWVSILNHWDGTSHTYYVDSIAYEICRG